MGLGNPTSAERALLDDRARHEAPVKSTPMAQESNRALASWACVSPRSMKTFDDPFASNKHSPGTTGTGRSRVKGLLFQSQKQL